MRTAIKAVWRVGRKRVFRIFQQTEYLLAEEISIRNFVFYRVRPDVSRLSYLQLTMPRAGGSEAIVN